MIKSILVCTDGSEYGNTACEYAISLTSALSARLLGLHVLDSRMLEGPMMADISGWVGAQPFGTQLQQFRELMEQKGEAVINNFNDRCQQAGLTTESWVKMGHPAQVILDEEGRAELLVLGQKGEHAELIGDMMGSNVERIVRHSSNPCLITPETYRPVTRLLAAYDGSGHAGQALQVASELSAALDIELVILTVAEGMETDKAREVSEHGLTLANDHGCQTSSIVAEGKAETAILDTAGEKQCDLIIVGAYGHSRIRELILGSTTTQLISRAKSIPVMLVR